MKFIQFVLIGIGIIRPCFAELGHLDLKGVDDLLKPEYVSRFSVANGLKVLKTDSLSNVRFFGNFGAENKSYPCHAQIKDRHTDCPQGPIETVVQHLFPSPDGVNLVANQSSVQDPFHVKNLSNETLGKLLGAIATLTPERLKTLSLGENKARKDELISDLTGILFGFKENLVPLRERLDYLEAEKACRTLEEDQLQTPLLKQIQKITTNLERIKNRFKKQVIGERADQLTAFSKTLIEALIEENKKRPAYPKNTVGHALLAYFWEKASSREDILDLYQGASNLIQQKYINLVTEKENPLRAGWIITRYEKENYLNWKGEFKNNHPTLAQIYQLITSPEAAAFYSYSYTVYDAVLPPLVDYSSAAHKSLFDAPTKRTTGSRQGQGTYPNCGEQAINSFIDILTYNKEENKFDSEYLKTMQGEHKLNLSRLIYFYGEDPNPENVHLEGRKDRFSDLVSNQNSPGTKKIRYLKPSQSPVCEMDAGITNAFSILEVLLGDEGPQRLSHLKTNQEKFDRLCKLFSRDDFDLDWRLKGSKNKEIGVSDFAEIEFTINGIPRFEWSFKSRHFSIKAIESETSNWRFQIGGEAAKKIRENKGDLSAVNWFMGPLNSNEILYHLTDSRLESKSPTHAFPQIIYGPSLRSERAKYLAIRQIATHKREDFYPQLEKWIKDLPLDDLHTQSNLYNSLAPLKDVKGLPEGLTDLMEMIKHAVNKEPQAAFFFAAENGYTDVVKMLIEAKAPIDVKNSFGFTPLHEATFQGHTETVEALIEAKASINAKDNTGSTSLHLAAFRGHTKIVKVLLEANASIDGKDSSGSIALHKAASEGHTEIVKALLDLETKAPIDAKNNTGATPLHLAAFRGRTEIVKALLEAKAPIDAKDNTGSTPLYWAALGNKLDMVKLLAEHSTFGQIQEELEKPLSQNILIILKEFLSLKEK